MFTFRKHPLAAIFLMAFIFVGVSNLSASSLCGMPSQFAQSDQDDPCDSIHIEPDTLEFCTYDNALPFVFEDSNLTASGHYTFHHVTALGCDSDIVVWLTVLTINIGAREVIRQDTVCPSELPYWVDGHELTAPGMYQIVTQSADGCDSAYSLLLSLHSPPTPSITAGTLDICPGDSVLLTAAGGVSYVWSTGDTTAAIYAHEAGVYAVTVTDEHGCADSTSVTVTVKDPPAVTLSGNTTFCVGETATVTLSGAAAYLWDNGATTPSQTFSTPGSYQVTCTDNYGCDTSLTIAISQSSVNATLPVSATLCQGGSTVLRVVGDSTNTYQWIGGTQADTLAVTSSGTYTVVVTNTAGCQISLSANVSELPLPNPIITCTSGSLVICQNSSATLHASTSPASSGNRYLWSNGETTSSIIVNAQGTYTVTVTGVNQCSAIASESVLVNPIPAITLVAPDSICLGESVNIHAISPGQTYSWNTGHNTPSINVTPAQGISYYQVRVTNDNNCSNTASVTITTLARPSVYINGLNNSTITICQNASTPLTATTGASYQWNNGLSDNTIYINNAGTYSVTVSNDEGCSSSASITVNANPLPVASITENTTICQGQTAVLGVTSNSSYTYNWSNGNNTSSISTGYPGTYTVTVTNPYNCQNILSTTLTVVERPQVSVSGISSICAGESTQLTATSDMPCLYVWSTGDTNSITTVNSSNTYRVTAYNANGCSNTASLTVTVHALPTPFITGSTTICRGTSTTLTATGGVSYLWSNGHTSQQISVSPSANITYTVTATDQYGCRASMSATVTVNVIPSISILGSHSFCEGSSTTLTATGGSYYTWSTGENTSSISVSQVGTYWVTATNSLGCQNSESVIITSMNRPSITISGRSNICQGNTDTLTAGGASQYVWNTGETSPTIYVMPAATTTYTVTGYGYNGCTATASKVVNMESRPIVQISGQTSLCDGESSTLTAIGGVTYLWADGTTGDRLVVSQSGNYAVMATNAAGCSNSASLSVIVNPRPHVNLSGATTFCENSSTTVIADGGVSYQWSTGSTQSALTLTAGGNYAVTAFNSYGCSSDTSFTVTTLSLPTAEITGTSELCEGEDGILTASENTQYLWSNGGTGQSITITPYESRTYYLTVTNADGCSNSASATVTVHPHFINTFTAEICQGGSFTQYGFNLPTQDEPGTFFFVDSLQSVHGCDSVTTLTLTVKPTPVVSGGIIGNEIVSNYGNYIYSINEVENATLFEWSISNPNWTLSNSTINSVFVNIQSPGSGKLMVKAINSCGHSDTSLFITCNVGVEDYTDDSRIAVYPNPVRQTLHVNLEEARLPIGEMELADLAGRSVRRIPVTDPHPQIDCTPYANGAYILRLISPEGRVVSNRRVIISK